MTSSFIRNQQLCGHYQSVGKALLAYEQEGPFLLRGIEPRVMSNLRVALSFVPDSLLDSYLEDLLDLSIKDSDLFIATSSFSPRRLLVALPFVGLFSATAFGFYLSTLDFSNAFCVSSIAALSIPFALLWEWVPRSTNRRLFFARLIAAVISNRRGHKIDRNSHNRLQIKENMVPTLGREVFNIH